LTKQGRRIVSEILPISWK